MTEHFDKLANTWDQDPTKIERAKATAAQCKKVQFASKKSLLDFGGGTGLLSFFLQNEFEQITIADSSTQMLKVAQEKIKNATLTNIETRKINCDISEITDRFSAIITLMTLHHLSDIKHFFSNAANLLPDGGVLMIADLYKEDGSFHKHVDDFRGHNGFNIESLRTNLYRAGFSISLVSKYFEITKEVSHGKIHKFPLFFLAAQKKARNDK